MKTLLLVSALVIFGWATNASAADPLKRAPAIPTETDEAMDEGMDEGTEPGEAAMDDLAEDANDAADHNYDLKAAPVIDKSATVAKDAAHDAKGMPQDSHLKAVQPVDATKSMTK